MVMRNSIDKLPDDVLISIVSRLPFKQAGRTSVLARKWRYIWTSNPVLNFDASRQVQPKSNDQETITNETIKFVKWVNRVIVYHSIPTIDEFRIVYDLDSGHAHHIDRWIMFAFSKKVKKLELHLLLDISSVNGPQERYKLPNMWDPVERMRVLPDGCESLERLCLSGVSVTEEVLEFFMSNCPVLEELSLEDIVNLQSFRIMSTQRLRHLILLDCKDLKNLDICSTNLASFTFYGDRIPVGLENVSSLIHLTLGAKHSRTLYFNLRQLPRCLSQLETLELRWDVLQIHPAHAMNFPRLKKLVFSTCARGNERVSWFSDLINAAPLLSEIVLKFTWSGPILSRKVYSVRRDKHDTLKVLQIVGFAGRTTDVEMALYVIQHAVSLKKVVLHRQRPLPGAAERVDQCVRLLNTYLATGVELIVC